MLCAQDSCKFTNSSWNKNQFHDPRYFPSCFYKQAAPFSIVQFRSRISQSSHAQRSNSRSRKKSSWRSNENAILRTISTLVFSSLAGKSCIPLYYHSRRMQSGTWHLEEDDHRFFDRFPCKRTNLRLRSTRLKTSLFLSFVKPLIFDKVKFISPFLTALEKHCPRLRYYFLSSRNKMLHFQKKIDFKGKV